MGSERHPEQFVNRTTLGHWTKLENNVMTTERFLQKLFEGYVRAFASFRWHTSSNYADLTAKELCHFSELGEKLGFIVRREMNWRYPRDLCWLESLDKDATPFLYLERESKDSRMLCTVEKMLNPENSKGIPVLAASFGHLTESSFDIALGMFKQGLGPNQAALLFAWVGEREDAPHFEVSAAVVTPPRTVITKAIPYVGAEDRYWRIRFDEARPWRQQ
jgi:hypothetical protein